MTTRQEWFNKQPKKIQKQFKENCETLNYHNFFDGWINDDNPPTTGIGGAFTWIRSKEGHEYWKNINDKYYDTTTIPQTTI